MIEAYTQDIEEQMQELYRRLPALYDMARNEAYVNIGTSRDTSDFSCDSIRHWWYTYGILYYPLATSILMLMDGGGSNSSRHYIFKQDLQALVKDIGVEIRIAHYPPYTSKWNYTAIPEVA